MGILSFFQNLLGGQAGSSAADTDFDTNDSGFTNNAVVNPANGQLMVGGIGGIDTLGNVYGHDNSNDPFNSTDTFDFGGMDSGMGSDF